VLVALGFPVALVLAWALEITPQGTIRKQSDVDSASARANSDTRRGQSRSVATLPTDRTVDSLAVLPFETATDTPDAEYLSDGLTESLINIFAEFSNLRVVARNTVFRLKGSDPADAGQELGVRTVLTGRVFQRDEDLVIRAGLIDVAANSQLWGQQYRRKIADIFRIQEEISREIASRLRTKISGTQIQNLTQQGTRVHEAYQSYLRGRFCWNQRTLSGMRDAVDHFNTAIEQDPAYATAYSGLGDALAMLGIYQGLPPQDAFPRAKAAAQRALEIEEDLAEAFATWGFALLYFDWDIEAAKEKLETAIELKPQYASAHQWYAMCLGLAASTDEAMQEFELAHELDPFSASIDYTAAWPLYWAHRTDAAIERLRKATELHPTFWGAHYFLGLAYAQKQEFYDAIASLLRAKELGDTSWLLEGLGHCYARAGRKSDAEGILRSLEERSRESYVSPYSHAVVHAGLGNSDEVMHWLQAALTDRSWRMVWLGVDPFFDSVRADRRFQELLANVVGTSS
jgi:TolB-like protein